MAAPRYDGFKPTKPTKPGAKPFSSGKQRKWKLGQGREVDQASYKANHRCRNNVCRRDADACVQSGSVNLVILESSISDAGQWNTDIRQPVICWSCVWSASSVLNKRQVRCNVTPNAMPVAQLLGAERKRDLAVLDLIAHTGHSCLPMAEINVRFGVVLVCCYSRVAPCWGWLCVQSRCDLRVPRAF